MLDASHVSAVPCDFCFIVTFHFLMSIVTCCCMSSSQACCCSAQATRSRVHSRTTPPATLHTIRRSLLAQTWRLSRSSSASARRLCAVCCVTPLITQYLVEVSHCSRGAHATAHCNRVACSNPAMMPRSSVLQICGFVAEHASTMARTSIAARFAGLFTLCTGHLKNYAHGLLLFKGCVGAGSAGRSSWPSSWSSRIPLVPCKPGPAQAHAPRAAGCLRKTAAHAATRALSLTEEPSWATQTPGCACVRFACHDVH